MPNFYSPSGNLEVWTEKPDGYYTPEEWAEISPMQKPEAPTLDELKATRAADIRSIASIKALALEEGYSLGEVHSFEQQYQGARDVLAGNNNTVAAQFVISLAVKRSEVGGVEMAAEELAQMIINNYTVAKECIVLILGIQQGLETKIRNATTSEQVSSVTWPEDVA